LPSSPRDEGTVQGFPQQPLQNVQEVVDKVEAMSWPAMFYLFL
jgi:hypothetical protein